MQDGEVLGPGGPPLARRFIEIASAPVPPTGNRTCSSDRRPARRSTVTCSPRAATTSWAPRSAAAEVFHQISIGPAVPATYRI